MDFTQLRYFQTVARTGNLTRAAQELYVTQPNLSKSIARLEKELGVPLFDHRKGRVELNDYGRSFLSSVDIAFAQLTSGAQAIRRMYESDQHILSLACNISGYLPDMLPGFFMQHPEIGVRQMDCTTLQMIDRLLDRSATLGVSCEIINHDQLEFKLLGQKEYVLAVREDHPFAAVKRVSIRQMEGETFICDSSRLRLEPLRKLCQQYGFAPSVGFEVQSTALLYQLVENGRGIAILPLGLGCHIMEQNPGHHIRLVSIEEEMPPIAIGVVRHRGVAETQAMIAFENYVRDRLQREERMIYSMGYHSNYAYDITNGKENPYV